jgi:hypothetical protein
MLKSTMEKKFSFLLIVLFFLFVNLQILNANEIYINPLLTSVNQNNTFTVQIKGNAFANSSDIYGVQFDLTYNPAILSVNSVSEGTMLNLDGAATIFNYDLSSGVVSIYDVRNVTSIDLKHGIYDDDGVLATINFNAIAGGISNLDINNLIWVNSTITNQSVGIPGVTITNGNVNVNGTAPALFCGDLVCNNGETCSSCPSDCGACSSSSSSSSGSSSGGGGGGGGGSSSTSKGTVVQNSSNSTSGNKNNQEVIPGSQNVNKNSTSTNTTSGGSLITGGIIGSRSIFRSWVFYFIILLIGIFVAIFYYRRKHNRNIKEVSAY